MSSFMSAQTKRGSTKRALFFPEGSEAIGPDETVLWQGRPLVAGLAVRFLHVPAVMGYFVLLAIWNVAMAYRGGEGAGAMLTVVGWVAGGAATVALLAYAAAVLLAATTRYAITDRRIILQIGVALPIALTLPLKRVASAELRLYPDGSGDLPLTLTEGKLAYLLIWPHARPWLFKAPQPMLRCVPDARAVAAILARALLEAVPEGQAFPAQMPSPARHTRPALVRA